MEIGDIVTKEQILGGWLQLQKVKPKESEEPEEEEKGMIIYVRGDTEFLFKELGKGKYQLYETHARKAEVPFYT